MRRTLLLAGLVFSLGSVVLIAWLTRAPAATEAPPREPRAAADLPTPPGSPGALNGGSPQAERAPRAPPAPAAPEPAAAPQRRNGPAPAAMKVSFKLDPRLTKGLHMGERWVSPPTYVGSRDGGIFTVEVRAQGIDVAGQPIKDPSWLPAEPDMVAVSPHEGNHVEITVLRAGRSGLTVTGGGAAKQLTLEAMQEAGTWRVAISQ